ncbi:MAG: hypothetical protein IT380_28035 [Myxococcales bacterium]|nr:hypothetical protein [Myxococcales bacterium]
MTSRFLILALAAGGFLACSSGTNTGTKCTSASQCYPGLDAGALSGPAVCLDKAPEGYCTHECATDADCCALPGECQPGFKQVCSPFESTGKNYCFLSCETADIAASDAGITDANAYCARFSAQSFTCRSTGGGSANRKVCFP